jgi:hypothetical protein
MALFAATVGDAFGRKFVTVNYGIMYTAKGAPLAAGAARQRADATPLETGTLSMRSAAA